MTGIRVLLGDDHPVVQAGLRQVLTGLPDMEVVALAGNGSEAFAKTRELQPDVVVLDLRMPEINGIETTQRIKEVLPDTRVVIFSMQDRETYVQEALRAGVDGYVLKGAPMSELISAIREVHSGGFFLCPLLQKKIIRSLRRDRKQVLDEDRYRQLSERELQVLQLLVEGHSAADIGKKLFISAKTAEKHRANIMSKLGLSNLVDLIKFAIRVGAIDPDEWKD